MCAVAAAPVRGGVKAAVAVIVAVLLAGGLVAPAGGSSVRGAFANLQLVSSVPGELTISWDLPDPSPSDYRIMWAAGSTPWRPRSASAPRPTSRQARREETATGPAEARRQ